MLEAKYGFLTKEGYDWGIQFIDTDFNVILWEVAQAELGLPDEHRPVFEEIAIVFNAMSEKMQALKNRVSELEDKLQELK